MPDPSITIHAFEAAGLGRAPFRLIGVERRVGPLPVPGQPNVMIGAPGQPMGACQYCGNGIAECCIIRDADGRTFVVGNVCVGKTGDAGLKKQLAPELRKLRREQRHARAQVRAQAARERLAHDAALRDALAARPHPYRWMADQGMTRMDWAEWMLANAGDKGRTEVARYLDTITTGSA